MSTAAQPDIDRDYTVVMIDMQERSSHISYVRDTDASVEEIATSVVNHLENEFPGSEWGVAAMFEGIISNCVGIPDKYRA